MTGLTEQQLAEIAALLGDAKPATDSLLLSVAEQIRDRREHDHASAGPDWDWYCLNASGWLGDKAPTVIRRLLDAEAQAESFRVQLNELSRDVDAKDARTAELEQLLAVAQAPRVRPVPRPMRFDGVPDAVLEAALRDFVAAHLDYDMHKYIEQPEDGGPDRYPELARELAKGLAAQAEAAGFEVEPWGGEPR